MNNEKGITLVTLLVLIITTLLILGLLFSIISGYLNYQEKEIIVKDKYIKNEASGKSSRGVYYIVDNENNTYKISDLFFIFKFNSTDLYNSLDISHKYKIKTTGFRIQFFSMYENINEVEFIE